MKTLEKHICRPRRISGNVSQLPFQSQRHCNEHKNTHIPCLPADSTIFSPPNPQMPKQEHLVSRITLRIIPVTLMCQKCKKKVRNPDAALRQQFHTGRGNFSHECHVCHKTFQDLNTLKIHQNEKSHWRCEKCNIRYNSQLDVLRKNVLEPPSQSSAIPSTHFQICRGCNKSFDVATNPPRFTNRMNKPYGCHSCHLCFKDVADLYIHQNSDQHWTCTGCANTSHTCPVCGKSCVFVDGLRSHQESKGHWNCAICNIVYFTTENDLLIHRITAHHVRGAKSKQQHMSVEMPETETKSETVSTLELLPEMPSYLLSIAEPSKQVDGLTVIGNASPSLPHSLSLIVNHQCRNCLETCVAQKNLNEHICRQPICICTICHEMLENFELLKIHHNAHGYAQTQCLHCFMEFRTKIELRRHLIQNSHWICRECGMGFRTEMECDLHKSHTHIL